MAFKESSAFSLNKTSPEISITGAPTHGGEGVALPVVINPASTFTGDFFSGMAVKVVASSGNIAYVDAITVAADVPYGVLNFQQNSAPKKGDSASIIITGGGISSLVNVIAGAPITAGQKVYYDFVAKKYVATSGANTTTDNIGTAVTSASGDGVIFTLNC